ncbi:MAG: exo-alpha-sialidase [Lentisphaerae bacterium]|nr:exo-alpha-sialidase [Lentisphaerota bacterium]
MHGVELRYQPERTRTYLGSPSIVRAPDGALVASHDYYGAGCPRNHEREEALLSLYRSEDDGRTWLPVTHLMNAYWSTLFTHRGALYLLGVSQQYGSIVIRRSLDSGFTWTHPADEHSGLLRRGGFYHDNPNYHGAPVPILIHRGRLYRAFEDCDRAVWGRGFRSLVLSVPEDADLLEAGHWTQSNAVALDPAWLPPSWPALENPGWLEGNVLTDPQGRLWNILRVHSRPLVDRAAMLRVEDDGRRLAFDPADGFIDFPGGMTKFTIRRDPSTGLYLTLCNPHTDPAAPAQRNILALAASADLRSWRVVRRLIEDDSGLPWELSVRLTGFQYVDWQFDGDDLIYLVRTAHRGARNYHDANRIVFHRLPRFRTDLPSLAGNGQ